MQWTPEQEQAIYTEGKDILVSAAAGSGKTAVLVERIIQKILSTENPIDIDSLLVVTFTNAAAQEMRTRVGLALEEAVKERPNSHHLKKQLSLLQQASISTLHSFCMHVIRENAYLLEIDPGFRMMSDLESDLLKQDAIDELFEEKYGKAGEEADRFFAVVDRFSGDRSDAAVEDLILNLHTFAKQHPWPKEWLKQLGTVYEIPENAEEANIPWLRLLKEEVNDQFEAIEQEIYLAMEMARESDGPYHYLEALESDLDQLNQAREKNNWEDLQKFMQESSFKRLSSKRVECNADKREQVRDRRNDYRKRWNDLKDQLFTRDLASHLDDMRELAPVIRELSKIVQAFDDRYAKLKREQGFVDYSDLEHFCLHILLDESATIDKIVPSKVAEQYKQKYQEVLIDEYQDTNLVQETILTLLTDQAGPGNMFMVGDVKQSIYRFRHAEPTLFIEKYNKFAKDDHPAKRIDLARNFRSRQSVLTATNYIFRQLLDEKVGEINYDEEAELVYANKTYDQLQVAADHAEVIMIDHDPEQVDEQQSSAEEDYRDLETAQIEARAYAQKIKSWLGKNNSSPLQVVDSTTKRLRNVQYKDIVILLRSMNWAPIIVEELKSHGIPVYAELSTGYLDAIEIKVMLSFLKIIDNPHQDIPLAAVLRSPIVGLNEEELTQIRLTNKRDSYFTALKDFANQSSTETAQKIKTFLKDYSLMRFLSQQESLSKLLWYIYRLTGYYDFVGGMPGGRQRQANLRALYDRVKAYEETSFRGLFRFLRLIERMEERGDDLGTARALSEQEDVVRITTIHSSKGLEFPVVILGGIGRQFNLQDLNQKYLLHKDLGFASKFIDPIKRITYPTLFYHAVRKKMLQEQLAEEMRTLYVALTRAQEKLVMVGSVRNLERERERWLDLVEHPEWLLPAHIRKDGRTYLDWIGPSLVRHQANDILRKDTKLPENLDSNITADQSTWDVSIIHAQELTNIKKEISPIDDEQLEHSIKEWRLLPLENESLDKFVADRLYFSYPHISATKVQAKLSVTEMKRQVESQDEYIDQEIAGSFHQYTFNRPQFMQEEKTLSAAEIGTIMHKVMQHLPLSKPLSKTEIERELDRMIEQEILLAEERSAVNIPAIEKFYQTELAAHIFNQEEVFREVPFSLAKRAKEIIEVLPDSRTETMLIQGVIDCLIPKDSGWIILDYKTDSINEKVDEELMKKLKERYDMQMNLYKQAVESIWQQPVHQIYLYFFDRSLTIKMLEDK